MPSADPRRDEAGGKQPERQAAHHPGERPAGVARDRRCQHGQEIVGRAPGQDLRRPEHRDDEAGTRRPTGAKIISAIIIFTSLVGIAAYIENAAIGWLKIVQPILFVNKKFWSIPNVIYDPFRLPYITILSSKK